MTAIIITSDIWKGYNSRTYIRSRDALDEWFSNPIVQLDPDKIMIIAGNIAFNRTEQVLSYFKLVNKILVEHKIIDMNILWVRGNRDYWVAPMKQLHTYLKETENLNSPKTSIPSNRFYHLSNAYPFISKTGVLITGFDSWYHEMDVTLPDQSYLPSTVNGKQIHQYLTERTQAHFDSCLANLQASASNDQIRKRIVVSHFPYEESILYPEDRNALCHHPRYETMTSLIDAWVFGHTQSFYHEQVDNVTFINSGNNPNEPHAAILKL